MSGDRYQDNLGYYCREAGLKYPDKPAIIDLFGGQERVVAYSDLNSRMDRVAAALTARGLKPGDRMILCVGNRVEFVEVMFGAMRAGIVPVPINTRLGPDVLGYITENSGAVGAVVEPASNDFISAIADEAGLGVRIAIDGAAGDWEDYEAAMASAEPTFEPPALEEDHLSFLPYTSGSTGRPKGVPLTHAGQLWWIRAYARHWPPSPDARNLVAVPLYHKNAMAGAVKPRLYTGGSFVLMPSFEPRAFLEAVAKYRCTNIGGVPTVFTMLLQEKDLLESLDFSALEAAVVGSAPVHEELEKQMAEAFGVTVGQSYGLTEGGPVMIGPPTDGRPVPNGSCGVAWPEGEVKLVDSEGNEHESYGELWVRNPGVSPGYYNLPEVNAERYKDGYLRTGDLFSRDSDGFFYFRGRTDDMFNCGGENVYPKEVENLLLTHPDVVDACVVPVEHATKGEAPVALVVLRDGIDVGEDDLKRFCLDNGPAFAHPRRVLMTDELPLTGAAKVDRSGIAKRMAEELGVIGG